VHFRRLAPRRAALGQVALPDLEQRDGLDGADGWARSGPKSDGITERRMRDAPSTPEFTTRTCGSSPSPSFASTSSVTNEYEIVSRKRPAPASRSCSARTSMRRCQPASRRGGAMSATSARSGMLRVAARAADLLDEVLLDRDVLRRARAGHADAHGRPARRTPKPSRAQDVGDLARRARRRRAASRTRCGAARARARGSWPVADVRDRRRQRSPWARSSRSRFTKCAAACSGSVGSRLFSKRADESVRSARRCDVRRTVAGGSSRPRAGATVVPGATFEPSPPMIPASATGVVARADHHVGSA
jgi:HAMP domain-containing protein